MSDKGKIDNWIESVTPLLQTSIGNTLEKGKLQHYQSVAHRLYQESLSLSLAQAGFLHGFWVQADQSDDALSVFPGIEDPAGVKKILKRYAYLISLKKQTWLDKTTARQRIAEFIPQNTPWQKQALLLFLIEQLDTLDGQNLLTQWSYFFYKNDTERFDSPPSPVGITDTKERLFFTRIVSATVASSLGWRHIADAFRDACLYHETPELFKTVWQFARECNDAGEIEEKIKRIRELLEPAFKTLSRPPEIYWRWRTVSDIADELTDTDRQLPYDFSKWRKKYLTRAGAVMVLAHEETDCYKGLRVLHTAPNIRHNVTQLFDFIGNPKPSGYKALHTVIVETDEEDKKNNEQCAIRVKLRTIRNEEILGWRTFSNNMEYMHQTNVPGKKPLEVRTPDGRPIRLQLGSCVLNFAYALRKDYVGRVRRALVNNRPVNLFHPLQLRDTVWLDIAEVPSPLPREWERYVPKQTRSKIRTEFKRNYSPVLIEAGQNWLVEKVKQAGISIGSEQELNTLSEFVEECGDKVLETQNRPSLDSPKWIKVRKNQDMGWFQKYKREWWYKQLGILAKQAQGEDMTIFSETRIRNVEDLRDELKNRVIEKFKKTDFIDKTELILPTDLLAKLEQGDIHLCSSCNPSFGDIWAGVFDEDKMTLTLHIWGCDECHTAKRTFEVTRKVKHVSNYFFFHGDSRPGGSNRILQVFADYAIEIVEIVSRTIPGSGAYVLRVSAGYIKSELIAKLQARFRSNELDDIIQICRFPDEPIPAIESFLPARENTTYFPKKPPPYVQGAQSGLEEDSYFYGMTKELGLLEDAFKRSADPNRTADLVFITGPYKVGKSSLAAQFRRRLESQAYQCLAIYVSVSLRGDGWNVTAEHIRQKLHQQAQEMAELLNIPLPSLSKETLEKSLELVQQNLNCNILLVVDEAVGMVKASSKTVEETRALFHSIEQIRNLNGVLMCWVGASAPIRYLTFEFKQLFRNMRQIIVQPLSHEDIKALLKTKQLGLHYDVELPDEISADIYLKTGGNPYWTTLLAKEVWKLQEDDQKIIYTAECVEYALHQLFSQYQILAERVQGLSEHWSDQQIVWRILTQLSRDYHKSQTIRGLTYDELNQTFQGIKPGLAYFLSELKELGTIDTSKTNGTQYWRITASLLAEYVNYCNQTGLSPNSHSFDFSTDTQ